MELLFRKLHAVRGHWRDLSGEESHGKSQDGSSVIGKTWARDHTRSVTATAAERMASKGSRRFRWLTRGPGRRLAVLVAVGLIAVVGVTIWRMRSLDGLPDVGDPFDVAEARRPVEIPDADNAFVAYAAAQAKLVNQPNPIDEARLALLWDAVWDDEIKPLTWSSAPAGLREYLEAKRAALEIWREGSRRRDAVYHQPGRMSDRHDG